MLLFTGRRIYRPHSPECSLGSGAFDFGVVGPNCEVGLTK